MKYKLVNILLASVLISGCGKIDKLTEAADKIESLGAVAEKAEQQSSLNYSFENRLRNLEGELKQQQEHIDYLLVQLDEAKAQIKSQADFVGRERLKRFAYLTPKDTYYRSFQTDLGILAVSIKDVKPYADGSKVVFKFGGLLGMAISSADFNVVWGSTDAESRLLPRTKTVKISQALYPGAWLDIPVILEGVPPSKLGDIVVSDFANEVIAPIRAY